MERDFSVVYSSSFERVHRVATRLVHRFVGRSNRRLRQLADLALRDQAATEYPFIFRHAFLGSRVSGPFMDVLAASVHLVQTSTFVTDDIFDESTERNGNPTICARAGVNEAIVTAEVLQSAAFAAFSTACSSARLRNMARAAATLNDALLQVYAGQHLDLLWSGRRSVSQRDYLRLTNLTTAALFSGVAKCGAELAGRSDAEIRALSSFARRYGMALQITDDVLDLTDDATGKTFAADLRVRRMRLPLIIALKIASKSDRKVLQDYLRSADRREHTIRRVARVVEGTGAIRECLALARRYCTLSAAALSAIPAGSPKAALVWLPDSLFCAQELGA